MKTLFFSLALLILSIVFCSNATLDVGYAIAYASAWASDTTIYLSASGSAGGIELGGYNMSVTGKPAKRSRFVGSTSLYHANTLNPKRLGKSGVSIEGRGYDGRGHQDGDICKKRC